MNIKIRLAKIEDINGVVDSVMRHLKEPGFNNLPAHPFDKDYIFRRHDLYNDMLHGWSIEVGDKEWARTFVIEINGKIKGYLKLRNYSELLLNKANLGMGLEMELRGKKLGPKLLEFALNWARNHTKLDEIILFVFDHNLPAKTIYEKAGFTFVEKIENKFQVDGLSIDDIMMSYLITRS